MYPIAKKFYYTIITLVCCITLHAQVSSIEELDAAALFHFSLFSDNKGDHANSSGDQGDRMKKALKWMRSSDFVLGLGDHTKGASNTWRSFIKTDPFYSTKFYPSIGDGECETYGSGQGDWSAGRKFFSELPGFWNRPNIEPNTRFSPIDGNYPDYYWFYEKAGITIHVISLTFSDSAAFHEKSRLFLLDKIQELAALKTNRDMIFILAHNGNRAVNKMGLDNSQKDLIFSTADFLGDASSHRHERFNDNDSSYPNGAIWYNSGGVCYGGATHGYLEFHVFDNPPRFTIQYINTQHESNRVIHPTAFPGVKTAAPDNYGERYPFYKIINGPYIELRNWTDFPVTVPANSAEFVSQNVPSSLNPGETVTVDITFKNTGSDDWSLANAQALGSLNPQDNSIWTGDNRVEFSPGVIVPTDREHTFTFDITAPAQAGYYNFQWQMVDDGGENVGWFGDSTDNILINVGLYDSTSDPGTISDNGVDSPAGETSANLIDDDSNTKFLSFSTSAYVKYQYAGGEKCSVVSYTITSANDRPERDPRDVVLKGSNDGSNWSTLDTRNGISFGSRFEKQLFNFSNSTDFEYYRLEMSNNNSGNILQLAEIEFLAGVPDPYEEWKNVHGVVNDTDDDDGDGLSNVLEFALGGDPNAAGDSQPPSVSDDGSDINFTFHRGEESVTYIIQKSTDLINWTDHHVINDTNGIVGTDASVQVSNSEMSEGKLFLRLKVE